MTKPLFVLSLLLAAAPSFAAVGCDLNDPDRDVARLFPGSTGYKTAYLSVKTLGGGKMLARIEARLGDKFKGLYETIDVPYTLYTVTKGTVTAGYIHGVNQKSEYGGTQVFLALGTDARIKAFYIQKLTSKAAKELRSAAFSAPFTGLSLKEFEAYDPAAAKLPETGPLSVLKSPSPRARKDFLSVLRAVKKNLILLDEFVFSPAPGAGTSAGGAAK